MDATPVTCGATPPASALRGEPVPGLLPSLPPLDESTTLRLVWPQWQGAGYDNAPALVPELPVQIARRGYIAGALALAALLPPAAGPTEIVPVDLAELAGPDGAEGSMGGVESRSAVLAGIDRALASITSPRPGAPMTAFVLGWAAATTGEDVSELAARAEALATTWEPPADQ